MSKFSFRKYAPGDDDEINRLYFEVTGRQRTTEQYRWQWHEAPGGTGEIWLIEAEEKSGEATIIGHHGIMPIHFSSGAQNLLAGKTENTMVHPAYRPKILYPRYERHFLSEYENKFDLLFSTMGPAAALRQRMALGYKADKRWTHYAWALNSGALPSLLASGISHRTNSPLASGAVNLANIGASFLRLLKIRTGRNLKTLPLACLNSSEAMCHPFFDCFWGSARNKYVLTPTRNREDLAWRFWKNPYATYVTLICEGRHEGDAYAIVRDCGNSIFMLDDIVCSPPTEHFFLEMLESVCVWVDDHGGNVLKFSSTSDAFIPSQSFSEFKFVNIYESFPLNRIRKNKEQFMLRRTKSSLHAQDEWFVTPIVFEGR